MHADLRPPRGLPAHLPEGERILWQGAPDWRAFAVRAFHARSIAIYFAVLIGWAVAAAAYDGARGAALVRPALPLLAVGLAGLGLIAVLAYLVQRTTVYTITNRRLVLTIGIALPTSFNIPFTLIGSADYREGPFDTGDIAVTLSGANRIAYLHLWPHARPWRFKRAVPMLRGLPAGHAVAVLLVAALRAAEHAGTGVRPTPVAAPPADAETGAGVASPAAPQPLRPASAAA